MHLFLSTIMAVVALTTVAAGQSCMCNFTGQMSGTVRLSSNSSLGQQNLFFTRSLNRRVKFEVDFGLQRARIYVAHVKTSAHWSYSDFFQDFKYNMIYRVPYVLRLSNVTGNREISKHRICLSMQMPDALRFPTCLPNGLNQRTLSDSAYVYETTKNSFTSNHYILNRNADCQLVEFVGTRMFNDTLTTKLELSVDDYKLLHTFGNDFFGDTRHCQTAKDFDDFFFSEHYFHDENH